MLTCSDDKLIKIWDWDDKWTLIQTFEGDKSTVLIKNSQNGTHPIIVLIDFLGHTHYVMQIAINPKDANSFATASLDETIKVWELNPPRHKFTLKGHTRGVLFITQIKYYRSKNLSSTS